MADKSKKRGFLTSFVDFPNWIGYRQLKQNTKSIVKNFKSLFVPARANYQETFEEAEQRLKLTTHDLQEKQRAFLRLSIIFVCVSLVIFAYTIYLLWQGSILAVAIGFAVTFITLSQAFRYHFWFFQISKHKLGCTFKEWFRQGLLGLPK